MKKVLAIILTVIFALSMAACGSRTAGNVTDAGNQAESGPTNAPTESAAPSEEPEETPEVKPTEKPAESKEPIATKEPEKKPEATPEAPKATEAPEVKPTEAPTEAPAPKTLGNTLLADFKVKAGKGMDAQQIADALLQNEAIQFGGMAMPVEEGLLMGFDNAEIRGFKSGVMFAPMIGSIPFVGYVFELANANEAASFIAHLEQNANRRWNICVEADETVTGSVGNKVFFVMCPTSLEG